MKFTGERVVPKEMSPNDLTLKEHLARYNFVLPYCKNKKILDVACGTGYGTELMKKGGRAYSVYGIDKDPETIDYARKEYGILADVFDLERQFPRDEYDLIVSFETIEHLENPELFLKNVAFHAKQFIFSIPLENPSLYHKKIYTLEEAQKLISNYFSNVQWFSQSYDKITPLIYQRPTFLVGVVSN